MANSSDKKSLLIMFSVLLLIILSTYFISIFARGYQINVRQGLTLNATGLLSATSQPPSASVYINDRLITATDDTINLPPDKYDIRIIKDGYLPWQKNVVIKKETVFQTDAQLFRSAPDLRSLTLTGAVNPVISPDGSKIIYAVASASATRDNGLYQIDLINNPLPLSKNTPKQITANLPSVDWSKFSFEFSPNSRSILAHSQAPSSISYLIQLDTPFNPRNLYDVTPRLSIIAQEWDQQLEQIIKARLERLPQQLLDIVSTDSARHLSISTSDDKVLYLAKADFDLPSDIITPPPAQSTQTQHRQIKSGNYYIYDILQDTNFLIGDQKTIQNPFWLPNSSNIVFLEDDQIKTIEYDATNKQTLFAGDFDANTVFPWSDGSRIITLTIPYQGAPENLYTISIR